MNNLDPNAMRAVQELQQQYMQFSNQAKFQNRNITEAEIKDSFLKAKMNEFESLLKTLLGK